MNNETLSSIITSYDQGLAALLFYFSIPSTLLIFPFYRHVYRINIDRDKTTPIFQIIQHFYKVMKIICILYLLPIILISLGFISKIEGLLIASFVTLAPVVIFVAFISMNNEFLLGILAIQRFFLYFFPGTEKYISLSENGLSALVRASYITAFITPLLTFFARYYLSSYAEIIDIIWTGLLYFTLGFSFFATLFYIPILISIRKLSHLSSAKLNKPQRYILWQLVVMTTVKCISMSMLFCTTDSDRFINKFKMIDIFCFPLIIQLTYLGCNKRNLDALLKSFDEKGITTILWSLFYSRLPTRVSSQQNVYSIHDQ
uniref:Serpentine Receptor, class Z n=1 Tax=Caenorhabditis tropicalis TaxID=1561998 RepID=A0A1I7TH46_9PELO